jgi:DNA repair photolyase
MPTVLTPCLFPPVPCRRDDGPPAPLPPEPCAQLVGIARLASSSPRADAKRGVEYFLLPAKSIVNRCQSRRVPFPWSINPYRGCEFGCQYCYARYTHEYMELSGGDFERKIFVKRDAGLLVARDLLSRGLRGEHITIGTATDPYQPAEKEFGVTRAILEEMARLDGLSVSIITKSNLVLRDMDVLQRIAARSEISINMTVTTPRAGLARLLEPRAPRPDLRLAAVRKLRRAGLAAGVFAMPLLPGITDGEEDLDALAREASRAGAGWFGASVLFLMPASREQFLPFVRKRFPQLDRRYREFYGRSAYPPETYRREIAQRVAALRQKYNLGKRLPDAVGKSAPQQQQLTMDWAHATGQTVPGGGESEVSLACA